MSNTLKLGNGKWATGKDTVLAFNDENNNFKPLPFSFSRASSGTVINKAGLIETVGAGEPRIDFKDNTKGSLLLEPTRSNLIPYSEDFENSDWTKNGGTTITNNYAISPDGTLNASRYLGTGTSGLGDKFTLSATSYTLSFYVKSNTSENQFCRLIGDSSNVSENLLITTEWTRLSYTFTGSGLSNKTNGLFRDSSNNDMDILIYGAQLEQGGYATSYIPTSGSAVTRVEDSSSQTPPDGIIGQTEGVLYAEIKKDKGSQFSLISLDKSSDSANYIYVGYLNNTTSLRAQIKINGFIVLDSNINIGDTNVFSKVAVKYKSGDYAFFINGSKNGNTSTDTNSFLNGDLDRLELGYSLNSSFKYYGNVKDLRVYNTALTDQELIALTTI